MLKPFFAYDRYILSSITVAGKREFKLELPIMILWLQQRKYYRVFLIDSTSLAPTLKEVLILRRGRSLTGEDDIKIISIR